MRAYDKILEEDAKWLLERPQFQRFLFEILETSGITRSSRGDKDALAFMEGQRSLGLKLLAKFSALDEPHDVIAIAIDARHQHQENDNDDRDPEY